MTAYIAAIIIALVAGTAVIAALCFVFEWPMYWPLAVWAGFVGYTYRGGPVDE
jgi:1,4-dihydroxy-2-naphthoate octaprenyltransferase